MTKFGLYDILFKDIILGDLHRKRGVTLYGLHKRMHAFSFLTAFLILISCAVSTDVYAYDSTRLDDASWVDDESAVTKILNYDNGESGTMDCAVSYLVDEANSAVYFQILTSNFEVSKNSDIRIYFDVASDGQHHLFHFDKDGIHCDSKDKKLFSGGSNFCTASTIGAGTYLIALDVKTKANTNAFHLYLSINSKKYDLIEGVVLNKPTTTKKPATTKTKSIAINSNKIKHNTAENTTGVDINVDKLDDKNSSAEKEAVTKFRGQNKYHTTTKTGKKHKKSSATVSSDRVDKTELNATSPVWNTYSQQSALKVNKNKVIFISAIVVGTVGLVFMGFALGKLSGKAETKKAKSDDEADDKAVMSEDDFDF